MRREKGRSLRSWIAVAMIVMFLAPASTLAAWHSDVDSLPGLESGGDIAKKAALYGGIGAGAILVIYLLRKKHNDATPADGQQSQDQETAFLSPDRDLVAKAVNRAAAKMLTPPMRLPQLPSFHEGTQPAKTGLAAPMPAVGVVSDRD